MNKISNFLQFHANCCGIALFTLAVVLGSMAPIPLGAAAQMVLAAIAVLGYRAKMPHSRYL